MTPVQTIRVVEDRSVDAALSPEAAAELFTASTDFFDARPTPTSGIFRVTAGGRVGTWESPSLRIVVEPKIPGVNVLAMIDPEAPLTAAGGGAPEGAVTAVAARLGRLMTRHAAVGLRQDYVERKSQSTFLTGKLDVPAHARDSRPPADLFHVEQDDYTPDIPANQFPKCVADLLQWRFPAELTPAAIAYSAVDTAGFDLRSGMILWRPVPLAEKEIITCAELLVGLCGLDQGPPGRPTLKTLDLHRIFEKYVVRELWPRMPGFGVVPQQAISLAVEDTDRNFRLTGAPDMVIDGGDRTLVVADTKWKVLESRPNPADVHQIIAYMHATRSPLGMLIYPGEENTNREFDVLGDGQLIVQQVKVVGTVEACQAGIAEVADAIRRRCSEFLSPF